MAQRSSKAQQGAVTSISLKFDGGLNYSESPTNIADNELTRAMNYIYNSQTGRPEIRPGTRCQTAATCDSTNPLLKVYYYEKSSTEAWLVTACNGKLYYLSGASLDAWTEIGALNDATTVPSFLTFNAKLLIADGGTNIKTWDGTTYGALADGLGATALETIKGRVVSNSTVAGSADLVTMSGAEDETEWDTADLTNPAVAIRAGYGDNMSVVAFGVFGDDLLVFKRGDAQKSIYRVNVASSTISDWYSQELNANNTSQNAHTVVSAFNNVFFVDSNGFKSLKGVTEYGDLQIDLIGSRVNTLFTQSSSCDEVVYLPFFTAIWYMVGERVFCYHRLMDDGGAVKHAFTDMLFQQGRIRSICQAGSTIYLAGNNGYLYTVDTANTYGTDEVSPGVTENYVSALKSKRFSMLGGGILRRAELSLSPILSGTMAVDVSTPESDATRIKNITLPSAGEDLYDATEEVDVATEELYNVGAQPWVESTRNRVRGQYLQFQFTTASGRAAIDGFKAEIAVVEG